jgi:hypothetical protein
MVSESDCLFLCPHRKILLYSSEKRRSDAFPHLKRVLDRFGIDCIVLNLNYEGNKPEVIYPFAQYLVISAISQEKRLILGQKSTLNVEPENEDEEAEHNEWVFETQVLGLIGAGFWEFIDDTEIGYPEKFMGLLSDWKNREHTAFR